MSAIDKAASLVHDIEGMRMTPPIKTPAPYGGRLTWKLPGGNLLIVHLKDKKKVLKKKRWSMVRAIALVPLDFSLFLYFVPS
jgi:chitin synthase